MRDMFGLPRSCTRPFGGALRRVAAAVVLDEEAGLRRVRVTYRDAPYLVGWDGTTYEWRSGPASGLPLPTDPERAADSIAAALGALVPKEPPAPRTGTARPMDALRSRPRRPSTTRHAAGIGSASQVKRATGAR